MSADASSKAPYWRLIAVLASSMPLEPALAMRLYHAARTLHDEDSGACKIAGDLAQGEVRNLKKEQALGAIVGPMFEAEIDTPRGSGVVRFIVTREGLEADGDDRHATPHPHGPPRLLN